MKRTHQIGNGIFRGRDWLVIGNKISRRNRLPKRVVYIYKCLNLNTVFFKSEFEEQTSSTGMPPGHSDKEAEENETNRRMRLRSILELKWTRLKLWLCKEWIILFKVISSGAPFANIIGFTDWPWFLMLDAWYSYTIRPRTQLIVSKVCAKYFAISIIRTTMLQNRKQKNNYPLLQMIDFFENIYRTNS